MARRATHELTTYRAKRDFAVTAEPSGVAAAPASGDRYVIQKHAARRLHYNFRLELDDVLLSWSVPRGPSLSPRERRLAVRVEDHPIDYAAFEGTIPRGEYGGGAVEIWDRGTWKAEGDPHAGLARGRLAFELHGEKLRGRWHLVRTRPRGKQEAWLLFKARDAAANDTLDITAAMPTSVVSGRTLEQIGQGAGPVWTRDRGASAPAPSRAPEVAALVAQLPVGFALTNLDKVLYPGDGITKGQLVAYYAVVADRILPHVANRLLTLVRCPDGRGKPCFYQKHILEGSPDAIRRVPFHEAQGDDEVYMAIDDLAGLVACAQLGALELHTWGSRVDRLEYPDRIVFDLDPDPAVGWDRVALGAFELRRRLAELELASFATTTGGKGLHVMAPIARRTPWDQVKAFAKAIAERMARDEPGAYTAILTKARRHDRIFIDYLRNGRGATFIAPYSTRAHAHATVATPIGWEELAHGVDPKGFTIASVPPRIAALAVDPWADLATTRQSLTASKLAAAQH